MLSSRSTTECVSLPLGLEMVVTDTITSQCKTFLPEGHVSHQAAAVYPSTSKQVHHTQTTSTSFTASSAAIYSASTAYTAS